MMRYMMMVRATQDYEAGKPPSPQLLAGMGKLIEQMVASGALVACHGLLPSSQGTRLKYAGGKLTTTDGPFAETKELIGGFAILQAKSKQEAIELAKRMVNVHAEAGIPECDMEIRPLMEATDFGTPQ